MNNKFSQQWLEILCAQLPGIKSAIFMIPEPKSKQLRLLAKWPASLKKAGDFSEIVKYAIKKRQQTCFAKAIETEQQAFDLFALPIYNQSVLLGILVVKIEQQPESRHKAIFAALNRSIKWLKLATPSQTQDDNFYSHVVSMLASCFEQTDYQQGLISMVTELTQAFDCERVAFAEYQGHYSQIIALSNSASFDERSNLIQKIAAAMDEAIEQDNSIIFPHPDSARSMGTVAKVDGGMSDCSCGNVSVTEVVWN